MSARTSAPLAVATVCLILSTQLVSARRTRGVHTNPQKTRQIALQAGVERLRNDNSEWCNGREHDFLNDAIHPYSALRDPVEKEVRVFLDAEPWAISSLTTCIFATDHWDWKQPEHHIEMPGKVEGASDRDQRFNGFVIFCKDPGPRYSKLVFTEGGVQSCGLQSVKIEELKTGKQNTVGACLAIMYAPHPIFPDWIENTQSFGIHDISIYYTTRMASWGYDHIPFQPLLEANITYYHYVPPVHRFYYGQTTLLNECIYRNRRLHKYVLVSDADELLHSRHPDTDLVSIVDKLLPDDTAALNIELALFFNSCPQNNDTASAHLPLAERLRYFPFEGLSVQPGKTIVAPSRVRIYMVHWVAAAEEGFKIAKSASMRDIYFKHVRQNEKCDNLVDERDALAFEASMAKFYKANEA